MDKSQATKIATIVVMVVSVALNALGGLGVIDPVAGPCAEQSK